MTDPAEIWNESWTRLLAAAARDALPPPNPPNNLWISTVLMRISMLAQVTAEVDELGYKSWQLHPAPEQATRKSWVRLVRVNHGYSREIFRCCGTNKHAVWTAWVNERDGDPLAEASAESLLGPEIVDLVAFSLDFRKCFGALGDSPVVGWPYDPGLTEKPVRVFKTVDAWIKAGCAGVVMIGHPADNLRYLRDCEGGVVCDDIAHGQAVQKMLRRPYEGPRVLVAQ